MKFFDTSVVIAYYLPEAYSQQVQRYYTENPQPLISTFRNLTVSGVKSREG